MPSEPSETLRAQRESRIQQLKDAFLEAIRRTHPEAPETLQIEILPDAVLDLFSMEIIDAEDADFEEFLSDLRTASGEPVDEDDIPDDSKERLKDFKRRQS